MALWMSLPAIGCDGAGLVEPDGSPSPDSGAFDATLGDGGDSTAADARDADPTCPGVPTAGLCAGEVLQTCPDGTLVERDCAAESLRCLDAQGEAARCGPAPTDCADLPEGGQCVGDHLVLCHLGWLRQMDCASLGGVCTVGTGRPGCETGPSTSGVATGILTADRRPYDEDGLGDTETGPVEGVTAVVMRGSDDAPLGFAITDHEGRFSISYEIAGGPTGVYLRAGAFNFTASHRTWVTDDSEATYSVQGTAVDDSAGQVQLDLHVTEAQDAGALNIFSVLYRNTVAASSLTQILLPPLQAVWERGQHLFCGTCHTTGRIFLLGVPDDTDEYDNAVISHEFGHYLAWAVSRDDTPGGAHDGTPTDPRLAWSEGLATWIGLILLDETIYIDTKATGATVRDPEDMGWDADPAGPLDQDLSEFVVLESLWDMTDPVDATDTMARPVPDVLDVLTGYLRSANMADRAHPGVDLVDFLDGWLCQGQGDAAALASLVVDGQGFPYDFAGPAAPCPKPTEPAHAHLRLVWDKSGTARVELTVVDKRSTRLARARLVLPAGLGPKPLASRPANVKHLGPLAPDVPRRITWPLPPGPLPAWVRVGVTLDRGPRGVDHLTTSLMFNPRAPSRTARRLLPLGGLLTLRIAN
jgi:hypothetical protein